MVRFRNSILAKLPSTLKVESIRYLKRNEVDHPLILNFSGTEDVSGSYFELKDTSKAVRCLVRFLKQFYIPTRWHSVSNDSSSLPKSLLICLENLSRPALESLLPIFRSEGVDATVFITVDELDSDGAPVDIVVKGRKIHVPRAEKEIAAFHFSTLCEEARSALDYLELAKRYRVFIVADVPQMNDNRKDAALRFMTLIDTLYEHHAVLALSAAAPAEKLYTGTLHATVFGRTVSRLMEMQSRDYAGLKEG